MIHKYPREQLTSHLSARQADSFRLFCFVRGLASWPASLVNLKTNVQELSVSIVFIREGVLNG